MLSSLSIGRNLFAFSEEPASLARGRGLCPVPGALSYRYSFIIRAQVGQSCALYASQMYRW
jgi:hypothetical protein